MNEPHKWTKQKKLAKQAQAIQSKQVKRRRKTSFGWVSGVQPREPRKPTNQPSQPSQPNNQPTTQANNEHLKKKQQRAQPTQWYLKQNAQCNQCSCMERIKKHMWNSNKTWNNNAMKKTNGTERWAFGSET